MFYRYFFSLLTLFSIFIVSLPPVYANESLYEAVKPKTQEPAVFRIAAEPVIRIGLATNVSSAAITTSDTQLISTSPDEPQKFLATTRVVVSARAYRSPEVENYYFEIKDVETREEAESLAADAREATGEPANFSLDAKTNKWTIRIGDKKESIEEANAFKSFLSDKGFDEAEMVTEKVKQPSTDAVALSQQLKKGEKSEVRSLIKTTGASSPVATDVATPAVDVNLREVIVNGATPVAKFSSLKSVAFGSVNEHAVSTLR